MEKTNYQKPTTEVYKIQTVNILAGSGGGGGQGTSSARSFRGSWDDNSDSSTSDDNE